MNHHKLNPCLHRDTPENLFEDSGYLSVLFTAKDDTEYPCILHYQIEGNDFMVDCSQVKDVWDKGMEEDLRAAIDKRYGYFFLSHKDLNLNIVL